MAQLIQAIKTVRAHTGCGLREGKDAVEEIRNMGYLADAPEVEAATLALRETHAKETRELREALARTEREVGDARARATDAEVERDTFRSALREVLDGNVQGALRVLAGLPAEVYRDRDDY